MAGVGLPHAAVAEQVQRGIDLVVHLERRADGARVVTEIAEVVRAAGTTAVRTLRGRRLRERRRRPAAGAGRRRGRRPAGAGGAGGAAGQPGAGALAGAGAGAAAPGRPRGLRALDRGAPSPRRARRRRPRCSAGWFLAGPALALPLSVAGPALAGWAISSRRRRYRAAVERSLPEVATAIADSLSAGRSLRASLPAAAGSLDGPPASELARLGAELDLGAATTEAVEAWRRRMRSERVDAFAAALLSQRLAGGDLAGLLRRFAAGAAERDRVAEDARSATAQARFTGLLVVAMPSGGALFAELIQPGFVAKLLGSPPSAVLLGLAAAFQLVGFVAIKRFSRVVE